MKAFQKIKPLISNQNERDHQLIQSVQDGRYLVSLHSVLGDCCLTFFFDAYESGLKVRNIFL